ncbi:MAG: Phytochrome-like protein cph1 [Bacteroidota bacterium]|jgi:PAS domain S-box-containing protein
MKSFVYILSFLLPITVLIIALSVLCSWQFNYSCSFIGALHWNNMNPITAVGLSLLSLLVLFLAKNYSGKKIIAATIFIAILICLIGALKLFSLVTGIELRVDKWLYFSKMDATILDKVSNGITFYTAFSFLLLGIAFLQISTNKYKWRRLANYFTFLVFVISLANVIAYIYQVEIFLSLKPMAFHTAFCFLFIAIALLLVNRNYGFMQTFTTPFLGSLVAQIAIPTVIIIPILLGYLRLQLSWHYVVGLESGIALLITFIILSFFVLVWFVSVSLNKTDKKRTIAEQQVKLQTQLLQSTIESLQTVLRFSIDKEYNYLVANTAFKIATHAAYGTSVSVGASMLNSITAEADRIRAKQNCDKALAGETFITIEEYGDVNRFYFETKYFPIKDETDNVMGVTVLSENITERKLQEEKVIAQRNKLQLLIEESPDAIIITDMNLTVTTWNKASEAMYGFSEEEVLGKSVSTIVRTIYKDETERQAIINELFKHKKWKGEVTQPNRANEKMTVLCSSAMLFDAHQQPQGIVVINRNITERKLNEEKIQQINKELEAFTYSVSHDLRAPLRAINGFTQILNEDYIHQLDAEAQRLMHTVTSNAQRMGMLIDDLLSFSKIGKRELVKMKIEMHEMVKNIADEMFNNEQNKNVVLHIKPLPNVYADVISIKQVWINLIANAFKYSQTKSERKIEIGATEEDDKIIFYISDNGVGFDMKYAHKLFGVFQRLHSDEEFEGTGVGLAIVQRIITKHGGKVWAEATLNQGAIFYFSLPK